VPRILFMGRKAVSVENADLRVTVLEEGGHIAEIFDKQAQVNPLWVPHWQSIEPSIYSPALHPHFGAGSDAKLLAGIMGHNLCLDIFGGPTPSEAAARITAHEEASVNRYEITEAASGLLMTVRLPLAQLSFTRTLKLKGKSVLIRETVENLSATDRPIAWTQHVTLAPPFLDPTATEFRASMTHSIVSATDPGERAYLTAGAPFEWPLAPGIQGGMTDLRRMKDEAPASGYTAHLADAQRKDAFFVAFSPRHQLAFGYVWKRADFPWLGVWEENCSRRGSPWDARTITRGMEFGVSPFAESRRDMIERGALFGERTFRWIPALGKLHAEYCIVAQNCSTIPETLDRPNA
jgi:hypothetical protein